MMMLFVGRQTAAAAEKDLDFLGASLLGLRHPFIPSFPRLPSASSLNSSISAFYRGLLRLPYLPGLTSPAPGPGLSFGACLRSGLGRTPTDFISCPSSTVMAPDYVEKGVVTSASGCHSSRIFSHRYEPYPSPGALCDNGDNCEPKKHYSSR